MKRWIVLAVPMLLIAAVASGQLITGGNTSSGGGAAGTPTVQVTTGLVGNGSAASPLAIITPISVANGGTGQAGAGNVYFFPNYACTTTNQSKNSPANTTYLAAVYLPYAVSSSHVSFVVQGGDVTGGDVYDFGLYNSTGALIANTGATAYATATYRYLPWAQGTVAFPAGLYFQGLTGNASAAQLYACTTNGSSNSWPITLYGNFGFASPTTTAGALATAIAVPTLNPALVGSFGQIGFGLLP